MLSNVRAFIVGIFCGLYRGPLPFIETTMSRSKTFLRIPEACFVLKVATIETMPGVEFWVFG